MTGGRKAPRWTIAFLRALERGGEVEAAARDAGIDKTTAYLRRRTHSDFAQAWDEALRVRSGRAEAEVAERVGFWGSGRRLSGTAEHGGQIEHSGLLRAPSTAESRDTMLDHPPDGLRVVIPLPIAFAIGRS